jgi:hypothetical protein
LTSISILVGNNFKNFEPKYTRPVIHMTFINPRPTCYLFFFSVINTVIRGSHSIILSPSL